MKLYAFYPKTKKRVIILQNNKIFKNLYLALLLLLCTFALLTDAHAFNPDDPNERYTSVKIIPEKNKVQPGETITIATEITLAPHWHVYWKNPGDSGIPVNVQWSAPENITIQGIKWPTPDKISYEILANYGYYERVVLLQSFVFPDEFKDEPITLSAKIDMLVCNEICIPESDQISITLNDPLKPAEDHTAYIQNETIKIPPVLEGDFMYNEQDQNFILSFKTDQNDLNMNLGSLEFFPEEWGIVKYTSDPTISMDNGTITIKHPRGDRDLAELENLNGLIVIKNTEKGKSTSFAITANPADLPNQIINDKNAEYVPTTQKTTWYTALLLAVLGGLILNLMPCVFPVLSLKALSLVKMGEKENKQARAYGIAYTLGVILSFILIGTILVILKQAGSSIGWGFHLQSPLIISALAYLLFAIGLNLMGFFDINTSIGNAGSKLTQGNSLSSSFFTGALVTIVATPCIGPFLGAAMGFALTQSAAFSIAFFASMGLGLSLPYIILSFIPATRTLLPRPGAWMNTFKQFLAFPMFAFTIWLLWILSQQAGPMGLLIGLCGILLISFLVWLTQFKSTEKAKTITSILSLLTLAALCYTLFSLKNADTYTPEHQAMSNFGADFSEQSLAQLLQTDDPVFVEMTAAWCFTCKINHAVAINIDSTKKAFLDHNVQYLIGDWTNNDPEITEYLKRYGRNGVPLYVFYPPRDQDGKRPDAVILPQILTPAIVQETIGL